jgi:TPR repeat protein
VWALGAVLNLLVSDASLDAPGSARLKTALQHVVASCHQQELSKRVQSVDALIQLVRTAVGDANAHTATRLLKMARSRKGRVVAALALLIAAAAGGWWYRDVRRSSEASAKESANRLRAYEMHEKLVELAIDGFKSIFEPFLTPLTKRTGPLEMQVEYASRLASSGDATAKGLFGFTILLCRGSTLEVQRQRKTLPREERHQTSSYVLKRFFKVERSEQDRALAIKDEIDIEERAFEAVLNICSESNVRQGITWIEEVASNGQAGAAALLAQALYEGGGGLPNDPSRALYWAKKAIEGGHPQGYRVLADLYLKGKAVPLNLELSIENSQKAARYGDILSQYRMAVAFKSDLHPRWPVNYAEAYKWALLSSANDQGMLIGIKNTVPEMSQYERLRQEANKLRAELEKRLTPEQQARVQRQASEWRPLTFHPSTMRFSAEEHEAIRKVVLGDEPAAATSAK